MRKKEEKYFSSAIPGTKMYLDDIEELIEILKEYDLNIEISDDDNIYDSLDELKKIKGENPSKIKIHGKPEEGSFAEWMNIEITSVGSTIYVNQSKSLQLPAHRIEKILLERKRKPLYSVFNKKFAKSQIKTSLIVGVILFLFSFEYESLKKASIAMGCIALAWMVVYVLCELNPNSNTDIELKRRHAQGFYRRNRDKIIIGVLMTIVGAGLTLLITFLTTQLQG